jgi:hypothetical protein
MAIGYSASDATIHPAIRYAGRLASDPVNTITQTETTLIQGAGAQVGTCGDTCERWGDYSAMTLDPDGCTFWYTSEYYADLSLNDHTRIGSFVFPSCVTPPDFSLFPSPTSLSVRQGFGATSSVTISRTNFSTSIPLSVTGLPAGATGTFSPNPATGGSSTLTIATSNCGTVTPVGTYTLTIHGVAGGLTRTTTVGLTVTNGPPKMTLPVSGLFAGSALGFTTTPAHTSWSACDPDGIASYSLQRQINGGNFYSVTLGSLTSTSVNQSLTDSTTYRYRVRAIDALGAGSAWVYGPSFQPLVTDESNAAVTYTGSWPMTAFTSDYGGTLRYTTATGASASYTFTGSSIGWVAYKAPNRGSASIYIDGVLKASVSMYSPTYSSKPIAYTFSWSTNGVHTIQVVDDGTVGHPRIDVDAFVRLLQL